MNTNTTTRKTSTAAAQQQQQHEEQEQEGERGRGRGRGRKRVGWKQQGSISRLLLHERQKSGFYCGSWRSSCGGLFRNMWGVWHSRAKIARFLGPASQANSLSASLSYPTKGWRSFCPECERLNRDIAGCSTKATKVLKCKLASPTTDQHALQALQGYYEQTNPLPCPGGPDEIETTRTLHYAPHTL